VRNTRRRKGKTGFVRLNKARLDELVEEAIVDCYNESEQVTGLYTMIEDNLAVPFETTVLGAQVTVVRVQLTSRDEIVAVCRRAATRQRATPRSSIAVTTASRQRVDRGLSPLAARRLGRVRCTPCLDEAASQRRSNRQMNRQSDRLSDESIST